MIERIQPSELYPSERLGFTQVTTATAGTSVWVAGQTACDRSGRPVGGSDHGLQADAALENLGHALAAAGASPDDVTKLNVYIVDLDREKAVRVAARVARFFEGARTPASTWVGVTSLMHPDFLIEIEATAAIVPEVDRPSRAHATASVAFRDDPARGAARLG
jgi:enamine deaminase RidA (YjgF/YER057c/UK114 family)